MYERDDIIDGYNWTRFPFREDPNTHQRICKDCWNGTHGEWIATANSRRFDRGCKVDGCCCLCYAVRKDADRRGEIKPAATVARRTAEQEALASPDNPLRAENPAFK